MSLARLFHGTPIPQQERTPLICLLQMAKAVKQMSVRVENDENQNPQLVLSLLSLNCAILGHSSLD